MSKEYRKMNEKGQEYYKDTQNYAIGFGILTILLAFIVLLYLFLK